MCDLLKINFNISNRNNVKSTKYHFKILKNIFKSNTMQYYYFNVNFFFVILDYSLLIFFFFYELILKKKPENCHRAKDDVKMMIEILKHLKYEY